MKYATKKEVDDLSKTVLQLAKQLNEVAKWQAYYAIKRNPNVFSKNQRKEILELAKGHITYPLFLQLFREYPLMEV